MAKRIGMKAGKKNRLKGRKRMMAGMPMMPEKVMGMMDEGKAKKRKRKRRGKRY